MSGFVAEAEAWFGARARDAAEAAEAATSRVLPLVEAADLSPLAVHNPGLLGFGWRRYVLASRWRIVWAVESLREAGVAPDARVLDDGAFFGNVSLAMSMLGLRVCATDFFEAHGGTLDVFRAAMADAGVAVADAGRFGDRLPHADGVFDAAVCMGVIEHIPHSPRAHLADLRRVLRAGGVLLVETPNLASEAKRAAMAEGFSPLQPIADQFEATPPFTGHHREYTAAELAWMLDRVGFDGVRLTGLDYTARPTGSAPDDPSRRELVMALGVRRADDAPRARVAASLASMHAHEAVLSVSAGAATIRTHATTALYAATLALPVAPGARSVEVDAEVGEGCFSVAVMDEGTQRFVASAVVPRGPRGIVRVSAGGALPERSSLVISNHRDAPAESRMVLFGVSVSGGAAAGAGGEGR